MYIKKNNDTDEYEVFEAKTNYKLGAFGSPESAEKFCEDYAGTDWGWK